MTCYSVLDIQDQCLSDCAGLLFRIFSQRWITALSIGLPANVSHSNGTTKYILCEKFVIVYWKNRSTVASRYLKGPKLLIIFTFYVCAQNYYNLWKIRYEVQEELVPTSQSTGVVPRRNCKLPRSQFGLLCYNRPTLYTFTQHQNFGYRTGNGFLIQSGFFL